jgi:hypothetical protein
MKAFVVVALDVMVESAHLQWQEVVVGVCRIVVAVGWLMRVRSTMVLR